MKILATIVTYNPVLEILEENIQALLGQIYEIIIIDNGSDNIEIFKKKYQDNNQINFIELGENKGIAFALNQALSYAINKKYEWLLTMDQDSKVDLAIIENYISYCAADVAQLAPVVIDLGEDKEKHIEKEKHQEIDYCITSGCLMNVEIARNLNGFDSDLFIDYVDFDYSWKAKREGYKIIRVTNAILYHRIGEAKKIKLPLNEKVLKKIEKYLYTYNHSAFRTYYYNRNAIYVCNKYNRLDFKMVLTIIFWDLKKIFFEDQKRLKTKAIFKGIFDGIKAIKNKKIV